MGAMGIPIAGSVNKIAKTTTQKVVTETAEVGLSMLASVPKEPIKKAVEQKK